MAITTPANFDKSNRNDAKQIRIDPRDLVLENAFRGRWNPEGTDVVDHEYINDLALNMIEHGQQQPIIIRNIGGRGDTRQYSPVFGFNRTEAACLVNNDPAFRELAKEYGRLNKDDIFLLDAVVRVMNKDEAVIHNIVENKIRKQTSPMDDAYNAVLLRNMGKTNAQIAKIMGISPAAVSQIIPLVELEDKYQVKIHTGELTVKAAMNLLTLTEDDREAVFAELEAEEEAAQVEASETSTETEPSADANADGTTNSDETETPAPKAKKAKATPEEKAEKKPRKETAQAKMAKKIREKQRESGQRVKPTMKEIKGVFVTAIDQSVNHGVEDALIKHIYRSILEYFNGDASAEEMQTAIAESLNN